MNQIIYLALTLAVIPTFAILSFLCSLIVYNQRERAGQRNTDRLQRLEFEVIYLFAEVDDLLTLIEYTGANTTLHRG